MKIKTSFFPEGCIPCIGSSDVWLGMCIGFIFEISGVQPANQGAPLSLGLIQVILQSILKQYERIIVNMYEGNMIGKINSLSLLHVLYCSFSCQVFALCFIYCLTSMFLVEMSCLN